MFYNTGIATYVWVLSNRKSAERVGKVQLIDATEWFQPLRRNLGKKNCELGPEDIERICRTYSSFEESDYCVIRPNAAFGYWKVVVERPLRLAGVGEGTVLTAKELKEKKVSLPRDPGAPPVIKKVHKAGADADPLHGRFPTVLGGRNVVVEYEADTELRDSELVPLLEEGGIDAFIEREVRPHAPDSWYVNSKTKVGYEINFNRFFYRPSLLRSLGEIREEVLAIERETEGLLGEIIGRA